MVRRYAAHQFVQSICYLEPAPIYPVHGDRTDSVVGYPVLADRGLYCRMHRRIPTCSAWRAFRLFLAHSDFICCSDLLELDGSIRSSSRWRTRWLWRSPNKQWRKPVQCRTGVSNWLPRRRSRREILAVVGRDGFCLHIHILFPDDILSRRGSWRKLRRGLHGVHTDRPFVVTLHIRSCGFLGLDHLC